MAGVPKVNGLLAALAGVPLAVFPNSAEFAGVAGEPKENGLFSAVGVAGAAPNWNGDFAGAGAEGVAGWPNEKPAVGPPKCDLAASDGAGVVEADAGPGVVGSPNVNAVFGGSGVAGAAGAPKPANGVIGCGAAGAPPNSPVPGLDASPVVGLLCAASTIAGSAAFIGGPKANGVDEVVCSVGLVGVPNENGVDAGATGSVGFVGAPNEKGAVVVETGLTVDWEELPKLNRDGTDMGVAAAVAPPSVSLAEVSAGATDVGGGAENIEADAAGALLNEKGSAAAGFASGAEGAILVPSSVAELDAFSTGASF